MSAPPASIRDYTVRASTTRTFGRVLASARDHHVIVDGPVQNGCPGEELTPVEVFLVAVASCGAELAQVIAKEQSFPLESVDVTMRGVVDRSRQARTDLTTFTTVEMDFVLGGVDGAQAAALVEGFKRR